MAQRHGESTVLGGRRSLDDPAGGNGVGELQALRQPGRLGDDVGVGDRRHGQLARAVGADRQLDASRRSRHAASPRIAAHHSRRRSALNGTTGRCPR